MKEFQYKNLANPCYYKDGCEKAHSDHRYYRNQDELQLGKSSFCASLNGIWRFHYARNYDGIIKGFEQAAYSCKTWEQIRVPAHIQMEGYDRPQYVNVQYPWEGHEDVGTNDIPKQFNPVASYVKYFYVPEEMKQERIFLVLEGAESAAAVWLNGTYLGYHEDSFTSAEFELTDCLQEGENKLAIQVFKWVSGSWCEDQDFFRFSGLFRDVSIYSIPKVHVRDLKIQPMLENSLENGICRVSCDMVGDGKIIWKLCGEEQEFTGEQTFKEGMIEWAQAVEKPKLWSAEQANLYDLYLEVYDLSGNLQECICEKVGFRRFELKNGIMCLNGKRIVFKGVNRHEFSSLTGRCIAIEEIEQDLKTMKRNNINAIRTSHYPNTSAFYRLCDTYGFYLIDEMNLETHGTWDMISSTKEEESVIPKNREEWKDALLDRAQNMYQRDKNHPSILIWSCGNESYGGSVIYEVSNYFRNQDTSRLVHYEGIFSDPSYPQTSDIESRMYPSVRTIREFLEEHREKPFICCEYAHAMGNSCGGLYQYTDLTDEEPLYQGGFIWDYIDQSLVKKNRYGQIFQAYGGDFGDRPTDYNFSGNGLVYGEKRDASPKMQEVRFLYQNFGIQVTKTEVEIENKNLFLNSKEFICQVKLEKEGELLKKTVLETDIPPLGKRRYTLPIEEQHREGEYCITVSFHLRDNTKWAEQGYEIAFGQTSYRIAMKKEISHLKMQVTRTNHVLGIKGEEFEVLFSLIHGGLISYQYGGKELLESIPKPNFWRAPTDNDCGNLMAQRYAQWKIASLYATTKTVDRETGEIRILPFKIEQEKESIKMIYTYWLPTTPETSCNLSYQVYGDGTIRTTLQYHPIKELGDMPEFGVLFRMNADYNRITWYGLGPEETYFDRKKGGKLGVYQNQISENMAKYLVPQECGNKEEVRYAKVTDSKGRGLIFWAEEENEMSFSALPYTPNQLEEATHPYELPPVHYTIVRVAKGQMGVGGDDSWGARTHEEHLLMLEPVMEFTFSWKGI